jgi:hypothetical protein
MCCNSLKRRKRKKEGKKERRKEGRKKEGRRKKKKKEGRREEERKRKKKNLLVIVIIGAEVILKLHGSNVLFAAKLAVKHFVDLLQIPLDIILSLSFLLSLHHHHEIQSSLFRE